MTKTQTLLWKPLRVRVRFVSFYSALAPSDPLCNMFQTLGGNEEEMPDEQPFNKTFFSHTSVT